MWSTLPVTVNFTCKMEHGLEAKAELTHLEGVVLLDTVTELADAMPVFLREHSIIVQAQPWALHPTHNTAQLEQGVCQCVCTIPIGLQIMGVNESYYGKMCSGIKSELLTEKRKKN